MTAYIILSGRKALIIQSLCKAVLFFHSVGNFSRSGHSHSTSFFHRLGELSISLSKLRNSSLAERLQMPPQLEFDRKSTGLVTCGLIGNLNRKSKSAGKTSSLVSKIWNYILCIFCVIHIEKFT